MMRPELTSLFFVASIIGMSEGMSECHYSIAECRNTQNFNNPSYAFNCYDDAFGKLSCRGICGANPTDIPDSCKQYCPGKSRPAHFLVNANDCEW